MLFDLIVKRCMRPEYASQFKHPKGLMGRVISYVMTRHNFFVYATIEQYAEFREGEKALEIGFGPGVGLAHYLSSYGATFHGIDISRLMYREASRRCGRHVKAGRLSLYHGDFLEAALPTRDYDTVFFANVHYFWDDLTKAFTRIRDHLAPTGKLVFYMSNKSLLYKNPVADSGHFIKYDASFVLERLRESGFADIASNPVVNETGDFLVITARTARTAKS